jgi:predicted Rossmann fold flavoprotein
VRLERIGEASPEPRAGPGRNPRFRLGVQAVRDGAAFAEVSAVGRTHWELPGVEPDSWLEADAVIVATGGLSFPRTGSDGTGYGLVEALGHSLEPTVPALTPLAADDPLCGAAQGVTLDAELSLWSGGRRAVSVPGSLLVAHFGYSGPAALDLSRHWLRADERDRRVTANFAPGSTRESLLDGWLAAGADARTTVRRFLGERMPDRIARELAREAGVDPAMALGQVPKSARAALIARVVERPLPVTGTLGYEKAEVTAGGVKLSEVNPSTLESRLVPGLYLCGEIIDVDGRLGGFNFQFAWSSGTVAGRAAAEA